MPRSAWTQNCVCPELVDLCAVVFQAKRPGSRAELAIRVRPGAQTLQARRSRWGRGCDGLEGPRWAAEDLPLVPRRVMRGDRWVTLQRLVHVLAAEGQYQLLRCPAAADEPGRDRYLALAADSQDAL